ncbi:TPA: hypothetical protein U2Q01_004532 [Burkholderia multivorans]|uniref:hypothetical protein n=1 Tax=Burkholderia multivorans TaxID=87883 RepID=UPI000CFF93BA|nr:hypothetical protein [Burkholderia multivorans]MBR8342019.1 hypothetical protein [Burkholderia multivorans]MBU9398036.1 hypothetical protein [Burkholderia multivorans]PRH01691.1 hypothetical protein C6T60_22535 [Burkholderia multivorans]HEM8497975.1 hypothetical protein [Burkholderia multivorans]
MRSETDWPPEVAGVLDLLASQPPEAAVLVGCFLAAVAHPDHAAELAMFDKLPPAARMAVGRFFSFFLAGGLGDAGHEKLHSHMQAWFVRQRRLR